jgi:aminoglycoside phosphotransferase (APT) family kinase protein
MLRTTNLWRPARPVAGNLIRRFSDAPSDGRAGIDVALVKRLIASQFAQWQYLPVTPVAFDGHDNRTYRLGDTMSVRLPITAQHALAVAKEHEWIPKLARSLPFPIPSVIKLGQPGEGYNFPWSIRGWIDGETASRCYINDLPHFAESIAKFLLALQRIDIRDGPVAGPHSWHRGASPDHYNDEVQHCLAKLEQSKQHEVDLKGLKDTWRAALTAKPHKKPVWFHGDIAAGNLLVANGKLAAVIDFGTCGVGDPACDLVIAWTMLSGQSRQAFRKAIAQEPETWARARGWALWKSLLLFTKDSTPSMGEADNTDVRILRDVVEDHYRYGQ